MMDGEQLTAKCTVHTGDGGALVWVMYTQDGNRTLEHHFDPEIISEECKIHIGISIPLGQGRGKTMSIVKKKMLQGVNF